MRKCFVFIGILSALTSLYSCSGSNENTDNNIVITDEKVDPGKPENARYGVKSGIITFEATMMMMEQEVILYFDDWGKIQRSEINIDFLGKKMQNISITDSAFVYSWDPETKMGEKAPVNSKGPDNIDFTNLSDEVIKEYNIKEEGSEEILGRPCKLFSMEYDAAGISGEYAVWKGIALRTKASVKGSSVKMKAVKIEENVTIPADKFKVPSGINFNELKSAEELIS